MPHCGHDPRPEASLPPYLQEAKFVATNLTDAVFEGNHILYTLVTESLLQGCKGCRADWR